MSFLERLLEDLSHAPFPEEDTLLIQMETPDWSTSFEDFDGSGEGHIIDVEGELNAEVEGMFKGFIEPDGSVGIRILGGLPRRGEVKIYLSQGDIDSGVQRIMELAETAIWTAIRGLMQMMQRDEREP